MIAIVDYGMGNVGSVQNALRLLGAEGRVTRNPKDFTEATHIILPGVGAFKDGMRGLRESGAVDSLTREVIEKKKPFLGICLGMQLLADIGEEGGETAGLGWIKGRTRRLRVDEKTYRLPHIGWNDVEFSTSPIFHNVVSHDFYFVHSYCIESTDSKLIIGTCEYGEVFAAAVHSENIFGVQFHPEKSQKGGLQLLKNFISLHS
ncbi:imidazole glycerol phosphate synthase, glutamine amidotransferase subunit [Candidatus Kaiserbacteria bacterium RIFCSPHIGHO2_02_FULL_49_16]|uniref:Imidazole glycerol phosphate synthase subunit HisH n=1 Tax=Candidatus Kaiserbacteria bacterium RIFCSPHIGHO2_02_FULL_49_16 TaxID=1798490 RepID=A0A1F6DGM1_9BACT|nr:MAG: imidazole glycerol phosphate synthase, glutamine amidotransferase subunit [Candidatus Kaiserbacteria bacterium RIFCSPHIGHO2_02_FULL_49_16]